MWSLPEPSRIHAHLQMPAEKKIEHVQTTPAISCGCEQMDYMQIHKDFARLRTACSQIHADARRILQLSAHEGSAKLLTLY